MWYDSFKLFNKESKKIFNLQKELLKTGMNPDESVGDNYMNKMDKTDEWVHYVKNDALCTAFTYASYSKAMQKITGLSMKDCLSLPGLG